MRRGLLGLAFVLLTGVAAAQTPAEITKMRETLATGIEADCRTRCASAKETPEVCRKDCACAGRAMGRALSDRDLQRVYRNIAAGIKAGRPPHVVVERAMQPYGRQLYSARKSCAPRWLRGPRNW